MYVDRLNGTICSTYTAPQFQGQEFVADDDPQIAAFQQALAHPPSIDQAAAYNALVQRRVKALAASPDPANQIAALEMRLQLLGG